MPVTLVSQDTEYFDRRFRYMTQGSAQKDLLYAGCRWAEGPVLVPGRQHAGVERHPQQPHDALDLGPARSTCSAPIRTIPTATPATARAGWSPASTAPRRVTRTEHDGSITVIADSYKGKRLNSPNDVVVKSDGTIWFTDPNYGIMSDYEGHKAEMEQDGCYVYRVDPEERQDRRWSPTTSSKPNGLAFSPDESILYIADSAASHDPEGPAHIRAFKVGKDGGLKGGKAFAETEKGIPDGFRLDTDGNVWTSAGAGDRRLRAGRRPLGRHQLPADGRQSRLRRAEAEPAVRHLHLRGLFGLRRRHRRAASLGLGGGRGPRRTGSRGCRSDGRAAPASSWRPTDVHQVGAFEADEHATAEGLTGGFVDTLPPARVDASGHEVPVHS